uniref:Secreted protein n=1 Tax=Ixodes scapularis TaxID=6945 RepID=A0A4D5RYX6_IXOSC
MLKIMIGLSIRVILVVTNVMNLEVHYQRGVNAKQCLFRVCPLFVLQYLPQEVSHRAVCVIATASRIVSTSVFKELRHQSAALFKSAPEL